MKEKFFKVASNISRWKISNPIESFLSAQADRSQFWKRIYVYFYAIFDRQYYKKGLEYADKEIKKQWDNFDNFCNLSPEWLKVDMIYSLHRYGVSYQEYFLYRFYDLNTYGRRKYNNLKLQYGYCEQFNAPAVNSICEDKSRTYSLLKEFYKRDLVLVENDREEFDKFLNKHSSFIFKPLCGHSGGYSDL